MAPVLGLMGLGGSFWNRGASEAAIDASGGTETTTPNHTIHRFNSSGTFAVTKGGQMQIMVVAGGGSGGARHGGGGG